MPGRDRRTEIGDNQPGFIPICKLKHKMIAMTVNQIATRLARYGRNEQFSLAQIELNAGRCSQQVKDGKVVSEQFFM